MKRFSRRGKIFEGGKKGENGRGERRKVGRKRIFEQIEQYLAYCARVRNMSAETVKHKRYALGAFAQKTRLKNLEQLDNAALDRFIAGEMERCKATTVNLKIAQVVALVRFYQEGGAPIPLKLALVKKAKEEPVRRRYYTKREIARALRKADKMEWLLIKISFDAGLRIAELTNLRLRNIHGRELRFIGKGRRLRETYIERETAERLQEWIREREVVDYLWVNQNSGRRFAAETLRVRMKKAFSRAGFSDFYPHALRHSFATDIQNKGATILELKEMLGHANVATTQIYIHGLEGRMRKVWEKYR